MPAELFVCRLGEVEYREALDFQMQLRDRVREGASPEVLLLLEHPPVYTRGRRSRPEELPLGEDHYRSLGIDVVPTDRGGKVTYHGPGQLVGYPIMRISDVISYLRTMESALIAALADAGVGARSRPGKEHTGVWVEERKIASIGVHLARGVTTHGFAVNVAGDLAPFDWVVACGLPDVRMTSVEAETGENGWFEVFRERVAVHFARAFDRVPRDVDPAALGLPVGSTTPAEVA